MLFEEVPNKIDILVKISELTVARNTAKVGIIAVEKDVTDHLSQDIGLADVISICLEESTGVTSAARIAFIARFPTRYVIKELIKLMTLSEKTTGEDIMNELKKEFIELGISFGNIVSVTTDDDPSLIPKK